MLKYFKRMVILGTFFLLFASLTIAQVTFEYLENFPEGGGAFPQDVSADGSTIVGYANHVTVFLPEACIWTVQTGLIGLGFLPGGNTSVAYAVSSDGSVIVGYSTNAMGRHEAFRWTAGTGMVGLGVLPGAFNSIAYGVSSNGSVIVGRSTTASNVTEAFRWTQAGGMVGLGDLTGETTWSVAEGVSSDGLVIVGSGYSENGREAFRWSSGTGMIGLGDLPGGDFGSQAKGISSAGTTIVGGSEILNFEEAFISNGTGITGLGFMPGGFGSQALDVSLDGSIVIGYGQSGLTVGSAFVWTTTTGMIDLQWLLYTGYGIDVYVTTATGISDNGTIIVGGSGGPGWRAVFPDGFQLPFVELTSPQGGELWIAGEQDTIKWSGGNAGQFLNIEFSTDSGNSYSLITIGVPADSGYYIWSVPQNILSTKVKIKISDFTDSTTFVASDIIKIKGYVLTRIKPDGNYEQFMNGIHGWNYLNGTLWPASWWSQFNYATVNDPYTNVRYTSFFHPVAASNFIDWPLWVEVFSVNKCYWSTFIPVYVGSAQQKWKIKGSTGVIPQGSCFGFAASSFLAFNYKDQFFARHPGIPNVTNIFSLFLNNTIQKTINGYFAYQFGKQSLDNDQISQSKSPRTTLKEIKDMLLSDNQDIRTITIYNNSGLGGGAHTMAPISVTVDGSGPSRYRVNLYDSNNPGINTPYILVDSLNNTWTDFTGLGVTWTGNNHFYLEIPISNYLNTPIMGEQFLKSPDNINGINNLEFYNTEKANVIYTSSADDKIGVVNGVVIDEIQDGMVIFNKTGKPSDPVGYYIPDDNYSVVLSNITDTSGRAYLSVFKQDVIYNYERWNTDDLQVDKFKIDDGFSVISQDIEEKQISLTVVAKLDSSERILLLQETQLRQDDTLYLSEMNKSDFLIKNFGTAKTYKLEINERSSQEQEIFQSLSVSLQENSLHTIQPDWEDLDGSILNILVDIGNNGTIDDTLFLNNEATGIEYEGSLGIPNEYNLAQNYPNPFNPTTTIRYSIPQRSNVTLKVYDVLGNEVASLVNEEKERGVYAATFDASQLSSGIYLYRLQAGSFVETKKMILLR